MVECYFCGSMAARCRCGQCRQVYFCNRQCQMGAWPKHRPECRPQPLPDRIPLPGNEQETRQEERIHYDERAEQQDERIEMDERAADTPKKKKKKKKKSKITSSNNQDSPPPTPQLKASSPAKPLTTTPSFSLFGTPPLKPLTTPPLAPQPAPFDITSRPLGTPPLAPQAAPGTPPPKPLPKSKKAKKKARSQSWSDDMPPAVPKLKAKSQSMGGKMVTWGHVHAREFQRCPGGGSGVPSEGAWALGLGKAVGDVALGSVDDIVSIKDEKCHKNFERAARLTERERKKVLMQAEEEWQQDNHHVEVPTKCSSARQRRLSISSDDCDSHIFATLSHEQASEFALIRTSREVMSYHCGCSCGDLVKKVAKFHVKKLVAWLHERDVDTSNMAKTELMQRAKAIAAQEKNCATEDCECARNGVPCHQDTCTACRGNCDNDRYTYDKDHVQAYRQNMLAKWNSLQLET